MTHEQKQKIEAAIINLKNATILYDHDKTQENYQRMNEAQNALYDAIGGMDDYKFEI